MSAPATLAFRRARIRGGAGITASAPAAQPAQPRQNSLAQIHIAKKQLGLNDDEYRAMLFGVARVKSAADLDHVGRLRVLAHLRASGFKPAPPKAPTPGRPKNIGTAERGPMLTKIEAMLLEAGRAWAYADGIAQQMFGVTAVAFCHEGQLHKIVAAMVLDQKRRKARSAP